MQSRLARIVQLVVLPEDECIAYAQVALELSLLGYPIKDVSRMFGCTPPGRQTRMFKLFRNLLRRVGQGRTAGLICESPNLV